MRRIFIGLALALAALPARAQSNADLCAQENNIDASINACTALIQSGRETTADLAIDYYDRGIAYEDKRLYDQAIADYSKAIALKPDYEYAYANRGNAYNAKGLNDQGIADETKALTLDPNDSIAYYDRGNGYFAKGLYDRAIADYSKAIAVKPDYAHAYNNRAWTYHVLGQDQRGLPDASKAIALAPSAGGFETRAEIYEKLGQRDNAIADYRASLKIDPGHQTSLDGLKRLGAAP